MSQKSLHPVRVNVIYNFGRSVKSPCPNQTGVLRGHRSGLRRGAGGAELLRGPLGGAPAGARGLALGVALPRRRVPHVASVRRSRTDEYRSPQPKLEPQIISFETCHIS